MNKILLAVSVAAMVVCISCNKEELSTNVPTNESFNVSILGEMGEFAATKSTAESCIRLKWEAGDEVYAYGSTGSSIDSLGCLTVALDDDNNYVALMTGTLKQAPSDNKLYLVHCPLLTAGPSISGGAISISLASQPSTCIPFVAYATVTGVAASAQKNLKASFSFASSVIKANVYGIANSTAMFLATLSDINTACKITFGNDIAVASETAGVISKTLSASSSASGKADFYIAVPAIAAASGRTLTVKAGDTWYIKEGAVTKAHAENAYINTICDMTPHPNAYVDEKGCYHGDGITIGSYTWAPVNCGYDANHTYGSLYQWGRKYGQYYEAGQLSLADMNKADDTETNKDKFGKYNTTDYNWFSEGVDNTLWNGSSKGTSDPCPTGWRVPSEAELNTLLGNNQYGWTTGISGQDGFYFNGTNYCTSSTGGNKVFLPAAGCRYEDSGKAENLHSTGSYWSSSPSTYNINYGKRLFFMSGTANMSDGIYRARGCSVRCVKN